MRLLCKKSVEIVLHDVFVAHFFPINVTSWRVEVVAAGADPELGEHPAGWFVSAEHERPDRQTGVVGRGFGRRWFVEHGSTESGLVKTALMAVLALAEHEVREHFLYQGRRPFDPHKSVASMAGEVRP